MTRAVIDTNIFVSAMLQSQGPPAQVFLLAIAGNAVQLCVSGEIHAAQSKLTNLREIGAYQFIGDPAPHFCPWNCLRRARVKVLDAASYFIMPGCFYIGVLCHG
ncbi:MAG TPA: PIN domain-containing protein [Candidatus Angelobacter sp.]|nr:PIN domain-containing protein [Candidatus Angelobacter sp.]